MASELKVDTISEKTAANGVVIDGVTLKDGKIADLTIPSGTDTIAKLTDTIGGIVQVGFAKSESEQTIAATSMTAITGLTQTFTPLYADSKLLHIVSVSSNFTHVASLGIFKAGTILDGVGGDNNNDTSSFITRYDSGAGSSTDNIETQTFIDMETSSATTDAREYTIRAAAHWGSSTYTMIINNRNSDDMRSHSTYTILEIQ